MTVQVTGLATYPLKSAGGSRPATTTVAAIGLENDRRWIVLDEAGDQVTARESHDLLGLSVSSSGDGITLTARDGTRLDVRTPGADAPLAPTGVSRIDRLPLADDEAHAWLSARLGRPVRLAHLADAGARAIGAAHGGLPGETMNLADAGPVLLVTEVSLDRVCELVEQETGEPWLDRDEARERFRPNVVVDGELPFAEDRWHRIRIGEVTWRVGELCDRCVMTTIDLGTLRTGREPIRTLARHHRIDGATVFGVRLIPELATDEVASVSEGDTCEVLEWAPTGSNSH